MMLGGDASRLAPVSELAQMRVSHLKANLESLDDLGAEHAARVRAEAAGIVSAIQAAVSVAWLPIELDVELTDAVERVAGRARMREWSRNAIVRSTEGPLLRPMLSALTRMGMTPHSAFKRVPYGWSLIYRGCGDLSYEAVGPKEVLIIQRDAPRAILDSPSYVHGIAAAFEGIAQIAGGRAPHAEPERAGTAIHYRCRWT